MKKLTKREFEIKRINEYYSRKKNQIFESFLISCLAGFLTAILIALVLGQNPLDIYQKIGIPTILWGLTFVVLFMIFYLILWVMFVWIPRKKELKLFV